MADVPGNTTVSIRELVAALQGEVSALRALIDARGGRMTKVQFMGLFFASAAQSDGQKVKFFRGWAEQAWEQYNAACDGGPVPTIADHYGTATPAKTAPSPLVGPASMVIPPEAAAAAPAV